MYSLQRFHYNVFITTYSLQRFHYNVFITTYSLQRIHYNVFIATYSLQRFHYNVFITTYSLQRFHYNVFITTYSLQRFHNISFSFGISTVHQKFTYYSRKTFESSKIQIFTLANTNAKRLEIKFSHCFFLRARPI